MPVAVGPAAAVVGHLGEQLTEPLQRGQVVDRDEVVDEGIGRGHAAGERLVVLAARPAGRAR